jgi:hypothetical protein
MPARFVITAGFNAPWRAVSIVSAVVWAGVNFLRACAFRRIHGLDAAADQAFNITQISAFRAIAK